MNAFVIVFISLWFCVLSGRSPPFTMAHNGFNVRTTSQYSIPANPPFLSEGYLVEVFVPVHWYSFPDIATMLNNGVCGIEIDLGFATNAGDIFVYHSPITDGQ
eukprot:807869_1